MEWLTPSTTCYNCGKLLDMATNTGRKVFDPHPGAVSICLYCLVLAVFDENLRLRKPTQEEADEFAKDEKIQTAIKTLDEYKKAHPLHTVRG